MHISRSVFIFWGSTGISLLDLQLKKNLIYLKLALYAAPQFSLCLKQAILAPVFLRPPLLRCPLSSDLLAPPGSCARLMAARGGYVNKP